MSTTKVSLWGSLACLLLATVLAPAQAQSGLRIGQDPGAQQAAWPRWQARIGLSTSSANVADASAPWQVNAGQLLGDYYWAGTRLGGSGSIGGFRATSGLLLGQRSLALGTPVLTSGQGANFKTDDSFGHRVQTDGRRSSTHTCPNRHLKCSPGVRHCRTRQNVQVNQRNQT